MRLLDDERLSQSPPSVGPGDLPNRLDSVPEMTEDFDVLRTRLVGEIDLSEGMSVIVRPLTMELTSVLP